MASHSVSRFVLLIAILFCGSTVSAQNKVVVIPMFGDSPRPIENVVTVATANGDFDNPVDALNSITDASESNPYLVAIGPGEYQLGGQQIVMKPYVEMVGSGKFATRLLATRGASTDTADAAVIVAAGNTSISNLSIDNTRVNSSSFGIYADSATVKIENVAINIVNGPSSGFNVGILADASDAKILHTDITLAEGGQQIALFSRNDSKVLIKNLSSDSSDGSSFQYGLLSSNGLLMVDRAQINVSNGTSRQWGISAGGTPSSDANLELNYVDISLSGGATNDQLGIELSTQGPNNNTVINHSTIEVNGGSAAFAAGISLLQAGSLKMTNSNVSASGATDISRGITQNIGTSSIIRGSSILGTESTVFLGGPSTPAFAYISDSFLEGGTENGTGDFICSFVFDEFARFATLLDSNCSIDDSN